ncbi:hypothetical protein ONA70_36420, partial [Micromonospora yasonensis]|uniref:glycogen debranching N-terminal domain-containing protein n=1 Tax=Micromonospora yasonensis TaxID=1128667 RepID=UPI00223024E9
PQGFFARNTRVLSRERITVDGREPVPFATGNVRGHAQLSYAELGNGEELPSRAAYLLTERFVGAGLRTRFTVVSYAARPLEFALQIRVAADFADTSEAETGRRLQVGEVGARWDPTAAELRLAYLRDGLDRAVAVVIRADAPVTYDDGAFRVEVAVPPRGSARVELLVEPVFDGVRLAAPPATFTEPDDSAARARSRLIGELA